MIAQDIFRAWDFPTECRIGPYGRPRKISRAENRQARACAISRNVRVRYLSRYLYRGVIAERDIIANRNGKVTFRYVESGSTETRTRTLPGADFLWLILRHVLPRGLRRVRDYGFLHGNAKKLLGLVQLILHVMLAFPAESVRSKPTCPGCGEPMHIASIIRGHWQPG